MIGIGKLIEYLDGGKFICALVLDSQEKRLRLLNQNGRELNLPLSRVVFSSQRSYRLEDNREIAVRLLRDAAERRCNFMQRIELKEIWDLVTEEANETFSPDFLAELVFGEEVDDDIISAFIRCVFEDKLFFRYKEGQIRVTSPDKVDMLRAQLAKEAQKAQIVDLGIRTVSDVQANKLQATSLTENEENVLNLIRDYYLFGNDAPEAELAQKILRATNLTKPHDPYYLLVKSGLWSPNENIPLLRNQLPVNFSLAARQQAEHLLQSGLRTVLEEKGRVDFTHLHPITIDGPTTLDFDDALSVEMEGGNYLVGIHISDVSHYVRPGDPLFTEAMRRGTSIYFPEGQIPMLPRHLSQGICSLIQDELRATVSFMLLLSPAGEVLRVRIYPSIIKVKRRLTYDEVDQMLESDEEIRVLNMLRKKLRQRRLENGALLLPFPDINIFIDNHGKVHVTLAQSDTPARTIVSEMMILANSEAAKYIANRMVPGLFRSQPPLQQRLVYGEDDDLFQNTLQRKQMPRGELSTIAKPHSGLGVSHYSTVTSPIRRLLDLVMQHQLKSTINRQEPCFTEEMCKDFSSILTRTLTLANNVRQQRQRYWLLKYLAERKGSYLDALVIQAGPKRVNLLLTDILMDIDLPSPGGRSIHPNTIVKVKIVKADPLDNIVRFDW